MKNMALNSPYREYPEARLQAVDKSKKEFLLLFRRID